MISTKTCRDPEHCRCRQDVPHGCPNLRNVSREEANAIAANSNVRSEALPQEQHVA